MAHPPPAPVPRLLSDDELCVNPKQAERSEFESDSPFHWYLTYPSSRRKSVSTLALAKCKKWHGRNQKGPGGRGGESKDVLPCTTSPTELLGHGHAQLELG